MIEVFNYHDKRASLARLRSLISPVLVTMLFAGGIIAFSSGVLLLLVGESVGWLFIGAWSLLWIAALYRNMYLEDIPIDERSGGLHGLCDVRLLSKLPPSPSLIDFVNASTRLSEGRFLAQRFGVGADFVKHLAASDTNDMGLMYQFINEAMAKTGSKMITPGVVIVAVIKMNPDHVALLASLNTSLEDLYLGIDWYRRIQNTLTLSKSHMVKTGGVARDWSFGWTPMLSRLGTNVSLRGTHSSLNIAKDVHSDSLDQMIKIMSMPGSRSIALVGPNGVGKSELMQSFGSILMDGSSKLSENLQYHQLIMLDASSLVASGSNRGDIEALISHLLAEAMNSKNIILGLDNAHLFFTDGIGSIDIRNLIKPLIESSSVPMILAFGEAEFAKLTSSASDITNIMQRITVTEISREDVFLVMQNQIVMSEYQKRIIYTYQSLNEAYDLGQRYVTDMKMPGQALVILEMASNFATNGVVTAQSVRLSVESKFGIKLGAGDDAEEKQKLLNLENLIHERMINQASAVKAVSDALRRAQAGVRNTKRPVGTFLFLGPTGVGKTELAKSLADVYYDGEDKLIRIDMNEYISENDASRFIADTSNNVMSLSAQITKNPFSVVLLDEIEKAHPKIISMLLQMLDEGILRNEANKEISFRDAIVIATSNAGAEHIREYVLRGLDVTKIDKQLVDDLLKTRIFTSEFINRFDEVVMFKPLQPAELKQVVGLIIKGINKNLEKQKLQVILDDEATDFLVEKGNDPVFGARPMRRIVQKSVENLLANQVLSDNTQAGQIITITKEQASKYIGD